MCLSIFHIGLNRPMWKTFGTHIWAPGVKKIELVAGVELESASVSDLGRPSKSLNIIKSEYVVITCPKSYVVPISITYIRVQPMTTS